MIPSIETIAEDLAAGRITTEQAIAWLHQHASGAENELRDYFAAKAITGCLPGSAFSTRELQIKAQWAYRMADAMLSERNKDA